jgi:hypothetical protein
MKARSTRKPKKESQMSDEALADLKEALEEHSPLRATSQAALT